VALSGVRGVIASINQPARLSLVPSLLPRADLSAGLAFNAVLFNTARFVGPAIAGTVIVAGGVKAAFALNAATYMVLIWALWQIDVKVERREGRERRNMLAQIGAGYAYVSRHRGIGPLLLIFASATMLVRPVAELLPGFADGVFGQGAQGLAWMASAVGLGAVIGGGAMIRSSNTDQLVWASIGSILLLSASVVAFAFAPSYWIALVLLFAFGFGNAIGGISTQTLTQAALDDAMRGRVMSLYGAIFRGGPAIGAVLIGVASDHFGLQLPVAIGAGICLAVALWAMTQQRRLTAALHRPLDAGP
jgi:predicted MFS family arabinose efflux permease